MFIYYVYAYLRKSDGTPYYIGKGKNRRAYERQRSVKRPNDESKIVFLEKNLSEFGAFALERKMIRWYGRKDIKTGILLNRSDGGEGSVGHRMTEENKRAASDRMKGKSLSIETRSKISEALRNRPLKLKQDLPKKMTNAEKLSYYNSIFVYIPSSVDY